METLVISLLKYLIAERRNCYIKLPLLPDQVEQQVTFPHQSWSFQIWIWNEVPISKSDCIWAIQEQPVSILEVQHSTKGQVFLSLKKGKACFVRAITVLAELYLDDQVFCSVLLVLKSHCSIGSIQNIKHQIYYEYQQLK